MVRLLEHAVDLGITFFDSADVYMAGESERLLGEVFASRRDRVVIATKIGFRSVGTGGSGGPGPALRRVRDAAVVRGGAGRQTNPWRC